MRHPGRHRTCRLEALEGRNLLSAVHVVHHAEVASTRAGTAQPILPVGEIEGSVVRGWANEPAVGIPVQLLDAGGRVIARTSTDSAGLFDFAGVPVGGYVVREAGLRGKVQGISALGGVVVGVGDGGGQEAGGLGTAPSVGYANGTAIGADSVGPPLAPGASSSAAAIVRRDEIRLYGGPTVDYGTGPEIGGIVRGGVLGIGVIAKLL